jgi:hypothetical protein
MGLNLYFNNMNKQPYIYKVTNLINGRVYVGQHDGTKSNYYASGKLIRRAIEKYGKTNFKREIIVQGNFSQKQLDELEILYIKQEQSYFSDYPDKGYNLTTGGGGKRDFRVSEDLKEHYRLTSLQNIAVIQFSLKGEYISEYRSVSEASRAVSLEHSGIYRACTGFMNQCGGFLWVFKEDFKGQAPVLKEHGLHTKVAQYSLEGELIDCFPTVTTASKATGSNRSAIANCLSGLAKTANSYQWRSYEATPPKRVEAREAVSRDDGNTMTRKAKERHQQKKEI